MVPSIFRHFNDFPHCFLTELSTRSYRVKHFYVTSRWCFVALTDEKHLVFDRIVFVWGFELCLKITYYYGKRHSILSHLEYIWVLLHASKILDGIKQCCFERIEQLCKMSRVRQSIKRAIVIMSFMEKLTIFLYNSERFIIKIPWQKISWTERGKVVVDVVISSCAVLICFLQHTSSTVTTCNPYFIFWQTVYIIFPNKWYSD